MIKYYRDIKSEAVGKTNESNYGCCQAAFNDGGQITLRNYNPHFPEQDEIIVLSGKETEALFLLFSKMGNKFKSYDIPF